nr:VIT family protein [Salinibacterium sp. ZJ450]
MLAAPRPDADNRSVSESQSVRVEPHAPGLASRLNWLRAGVLGANDGIVSTAALIVGVAAATSAIAPILTAGVAGLIAGAVSMALGEYVSVSAQRDTERAAIALERQELVDDPDGELDELTEIYRSKGLSHGTARSVAEELTAHDALAAHLEAELHISEHEVSSPWHAALASAVSFTIGSVLPLLAVLLAPLEWRIPAIAVSTLLALAITGALGAYLGNSPMARPTIRVIIGGVLALALTYGIGSLLGTTVG